MVIAVSFHSQGTTAAKKLNSFHFWLPWPVFLTSPCSHFKALVMPRICLSITTNEHTEVHRQLEQISHLHSNASSDDCTSIIALLECICITFNVEKN